MQDAHPKFIENFTKATGCGVGSVLMLGAMGVTHFVPGLQFVTIGLGVAAAAGAFGTGAFIGKAWRAEHGGEERPKPQRVAVKLPSLRLGAPSPGGA